MMYLHVLATAESLGDRSTGVPPTGAACLDHFSCECISSGTLLSVLSVIDMRSELFTKSCTYTSDVDRIGEVTRAVHEPMSNRYIWVEYTRRCCNSMRLMSPDEARRSSKRLLGGQVAEAASDLCESIWPMALHSKRPLREVSQWAKVSAIWCRSVGKHSRTHVACRSRARG